MVQADISDLVAAQRALDHAAVLDADLKGLSESEQDPGRLLRGISLILTEQSAEGVALLGHAIAALTADRALEAGVLSELALGHFLLGRTDDALILFQRQLDASPDDAVNYGRLGTIYLAKDMLAEAADHYREAVRREPGRAEWHNNLGGVLLRQQLLEEALENYDVALRLKPELDQAKTSRDRVLFNLDRPEEVIERLEKEFNESPGSLLARVKMARGLAQAQRFMEVIKILLEPCIPVEELVDEDEVAFTTEGSEEDIEETSVGFQSTEVDDDVETIHGQIALRAAAAQFLTDRSAFAQASVLLDEILRLKPTNPVPFIAQKAQALIELEKYEAAAEVLDEAETAHPDANPIKMTRAHLYCEMGRYEDAEVLQRDLMETYPGDAQLKTQLGQTLLWTGKLDEAKRLFEEASQTNPMALAQMVNAKHIPKDPKAIAQMAKIADNVLVADGARIAMSFALAEVYDKSKEYDTGFHYLKLANDLTDKTLNYSPEAFNKEVKANIAVYTPDFFNRLSPIRESARTPIFVVGMPRSGTTLTEQILCSHNEVFGAGELNLLTRLTRLMPRVIKSGQPYPICLGGFSSHLREEAARFYLHGLDQLDKDHSYVVDKLPHNFMHVGMIHTIFPKAKIIHIQRDPRDTALSNYQQNFKAKHGGLGYSFNLEKIAHELNSYHEMMVHWRTVLPGRMLEITYEALVADQEAVSREMLEFVGVDWDENVTNFHETKRAVRTASVAQVRQKIYSSSKQKWRRYEKHLTPLLENLNPDLTAPWDKEVSEILETS